MLDILLLLLLVASFIIGAKRGLIVQLMHVVTLIVAFVVALIYYKPLAQKFVLWIPYPAFTDGITQTINLEAIDVDRTFYQVLAFALIFFVVKFALQIVASIFDFLTYLPVLHTVNRLLGAVFGFVEMYLLLFLALYVFALLPIEKIQVILADSSLTRFMLEKTPIFTSLVKEWWYIYIK